MAVSRADKKDGKEIVLQDFVRYSLRAANGLGNVAEEEMKGLIRKMVEIDKITSEEGDKILKTLLGKMQTSREVFEKRVEESVTKATEKLSAISARELENIKSRMQTIDQRIATLVNKRNTRVEI